jgi:hypothetical protein
MLTGSRPGGSFVKDKAWCMMTANIKRIEGEKKER